MSRVVCRRLAVATIAVAGGLSLGLAPSASAAAATAAGPKLTVPAATLRSALTCPRSLTGLNKDPVLLVPATAADPTLTYGWNYELTLPKAGYRFCTVTLPNISLGDIQVAAQYVVSAVRSMATRSGRKVAIIGMSQGGLQPRWALKFWPDLRASVSDYIGLASPNHGTLLVNALCADGCAASLQQLKPTSLFLKTLNAGGEVLRGPSWSAILTRTDDVVTPQADPRPSSALRRVAGVASSSTAIQTICPQDKATHIGILADPVASALVFDALGHDGPAKASRLPSGLCSLAVTPGLDKAVVDDKVNNTLPKLLVTVNAAAKVKAEPAIASYATH